MDSTMALLGSAIGLIVFMVGLVGFMRVVVTVGKIGEHTQLILQELRYLRHLDEVKAGVPPMQPPQ